MTKRMKNQSMGPTKISKKMMMVTCQLTKVILAMIVYLRPQISISVKRTRTKHPKSLMSVTTKSINKSVRYWQFHLLDTLSSLTSPSRCGQLSTIIQMISCCYRVQNMMSPASPSMRLSWVTSCRYKRDIK